MIHGRGDDQIPPAGVILWVEETCNNPEVEMAIQLEWFDTGHRVPYEAPKTAAAVIFPWIDARFAGNPAPSSCGNVPRP